jgi:hypothetical protein
MMSAVGIVKKEIVDGIVGKSTKEAVEFLKTKGYRMRTLVRDGQKLMGTADYRRDRINVSVENDIVVGVIKIG